MDFEILDSRPIWQQLSEQIRRRIVTGEYAPGGRLPSVRELAAEAGVTPNTMQRAMAQLEGEGLIITNRTAGRTVTEEGAILERLRQQLARERLEEYFRDMQQLGYDRSQAAALAQEGAKEQ